LKLHRFGNTRYRNTHCRNTYCRNTYCRNTYCRNRYCAIVPAMSELSSANGLRRIDPYRRTRRRNAKRTRTRAAAGIAQGAGKPLSAVGVPDGAGPHETMLLREFARTRDQQLKAHLVERFLPLARSLASRYRGGGEPMEDLMQIASVGLVKAIGRFDPERGFSFATFAVPTILGELRRHFRDRGWSVHVDRGLKERHATVGGAVGELSKRLGRAPSVSEISERVKLSEEDVLEAIDVANAHHALSIDAAPEGDDEHRPPIVESLGDSDPGYEAIEYGEAIAPILDELSKRDRVIVHMRFVEDRTQTEIAGEVGVSQMQVSRILRSTLERLRERVRESEVV
jgi:RNA polymerase sigma-B factor